MVDAAESVDAGRNDTRSDVQAGPARAESACDVRPFDAPARAAYAAFCGPLPHSTPQNPSFVEAWAEEPGADMVLAQIDRNGRPVLMMVLEVVRDGFATIARHAGGRHANGSFPAFAGSSAGDVRTALAAAMARARPDVDLVLLERNEAERAGRANPLHGGGCVPSPNVALAIDLRGGFDAVLSGGSGKRRRKKHRSQLRKFEAAGAHRRWAASTPQQVDALLSAFYTMKAERFRAMGVADVFAPEGVKRAFRRMFVGALEKNAPDFVLHGFEVAGIVRAVTGSSISGERITCEFSAFRDDELSSASPGDFLFFENIREACENGLSIYDFGVGDEPYKRQWCDVESRHFDFHLPITARGHAVSLARRAAGAAKRRIKANRFLWAVLKRLRKSAGPTAASAVDD